MVVGDIDGVTTFRDTSGSTLCFATRFASICACLTSFDCLNGVGRSDTNINGIAIRFDVTQ